MTENEQGIVKLRVTSEGRDGIWIPEKDSLKSFVESRNLECIHNFIPSGMKMIGADHQADSVLQDIDDSERLAVFTDPGANMGHSLAIIRNNKLECYDIGKITIEDLDTAKD